MEDWGYSALVEGKKQFWVSDGSISKFSIEL